MMATTRKLRRYLRNCGARLRSEVSVVSLGTFSSSTMMVMITAMTPSLKASRRLVPIMDPPDGPVTRQVYPSSRRRQNQHQIDSDFRRQSTIPVATTDPDSYSPEILLGKRWFRQWQGR